MVEACFGLTQSQKKARFFQLTRKPGKRSEDFVVNTVEEARVRLPGINPEAVFLAFTKQLDGGLAHQVKARQEQRKMDGTGTINWAEVVRSVREM